MKKASFFLIIISLSHSTKADQLAWLLKSDAMKATQFLLNQKQVLSWCACCDESEKVMINVENVTYAYVDESDGEQYYEVTVVGKDLKGNEVSEAVDLAYLHFNSNGTAKCVGVYLGFECDPCVDEFPWNAYLNAKARGPEEKMDWVGDWSYTNDDGTVGYGLKIDYPMAYQDTRWCELEASGFQTYYKLSIIGIEKGTSIEFTYSVVLDGYFYLEQQINQAAPFLTLKFEGGKVRTYWNQENLTDCESGNICFMKEE